jgi:hypothetical protein
MHRLSNKLFSKRSTYWIGPDSRRLSRLSERNPSLLLPNWMNYRVNETGNYNQSPGHERTRLISILLLHRSTSSSYNYKVSTTRSRSAPLEASTLQPLQSVFFPSSYLAGAGAWAAAELLVSSLARQFSWWSLFSNKKVFLMIVRVTLTLSHPFRRGLFRNCKEHKKIAASGQCRLHSRPSSLEQNHTRWSFLVFRIAGT